LYGSFVSYNSGVSAHRIYFAFLAILPFALAGLTLLIPGDAGLTRPGPSSTNSHEPMEILAALNVGAVLLGTALTIRAMAAEHRIFRREQQVGLSAPAYLAAKLTVYGLAAALWTAVMFAIVVAVKGGPVGGAALLHNATIELYVTAAATAIVSAVIGLTLSALGKALREVLPLVVPAILASVLFNGSLVQLVSLWGLQQISWFVPAQWGFAASASTVNLRRIDTLAANMADRNYKCGCLIGNLSNELADQSRLIRDRLSSNFAAWSRPIETCIRDGQKAGEISRDIDARVLADFLLNSLEGAMLRTKVEKDSSPLDHFVTLVFSRVLT